MSEDRPPQVPAAAHRIAYYAPLVLAILAAAVFQALLIARSGTVSADSIKFISIARGLSDRPIETFREQDQHPGFAAAVLASTRAAEWLGYRGEPQVWMLGGRTVTFVCGLLSVWFVWLLGRDLCDVRVANVAALVFVVLPVPRSNAADSQSDTAHVCFYLLAAWLAATALSSGSWKRLAAAGLASGVAYWIRPEGLEIVVAALLCLAARAAVAGWGFRRWALATFALAGCTLAVAGPYCILAGKFTSKQLTFAKVRPTPTYLAAQLAQAEAAEATLAAGSSGRPATNATAPATTPGAPTGDAGSSTRLVLVARLAGKAVAAYCNSICQGFKFVFLPFFFLGVVELLRRKRNWLPFVLVALLGLLHSLILLCVFIISGYIAHRHTIPLVGLAMPFAALGVIGIGQALARRIEIKPNYGVAATLALSLALVLPYTLRPFNREFVPVIAATEWVQSHAAPGAGIVCNSPYVGFYGTLPTASLGPEAWTLDEALAKARSAAHYDYVILHVGAHEYRPEWIGQIETRYRQIQELPDPYCLPSRPRKVLVFESKQLQARAEQRSRS
ncbi:MAG TPA: glycosyltransferase family 39 protein [Pirellulales bacterium]|nr:glycosyltransferase family 39 protein [Pirellulales bacterium]